MLDTISLIKSPSRKHGENYTEGKKTVTFFTHNEGRKEGRKGRRKEGWKGGTEEGMEERKKGKEEGWQASPTVRKNHPKLICESRTWNIWRNS